MAVMGAKVTTITHEMARVLATAFDIAEIRRYVAENRTDYENFLKDEATQRQCVKGTQTKRRTSRKTSIQKRKEY